MDTNSESTISRLIEGKQKSITFCGMTIVVMLVTPEIAANMLARNQTNRKIRRHIVDQYVNDMREARWRPSLMPVCITPEGNTANGGHRLTAIVQSGFSQWLLIAYNVLPETIAMQDIGLKRSLRDIGKFLGKDLTTTQAAIAKLIEHGPRSPKSVSFLEAFNTYCDHSEAIDWVAEKTRSHRVGISAPILAVVAKAWYLYPHNILEDFLQVLITGVATRGVQDTAAIRLRDYARSCGAGEQARIGLYKRAQFALKHFIDGKPIRALYGTDTDYFPLPEGE